MSMALTITNYIGIAAFSASGSLKAIEKNMDLLGVLVLGFSTALGGGIISDVLLGIYPPINLTYLPYPLAAIATSLAVFTFYRFFEHARRPLLYFDAVGLGAFAVSGASLAYSIYPSPLLVVSIGAITAVGGGVVRDVLANEVPMVLTREFYATAAILGAGLYYILAYLHLPYKGSLAPSRGGEVFNCPV